MNITQTARKTSNTVKSSDQLKAVIEHQEAIAEAKRETQKLVVLIAEKTAEVERIVTAIPILDDFQSKREDLLAALAIGQATPGELDRFDEETEAKRASIHSATKEADHALVSLRQSIAGLERMIAKEQDKVARMESIESDLLCDLVQAETANAAQAYIQAATELERAFLSLIALDDIGFAKGFGARRIPSARVEELIVPKLNVSGFENNPRYLYWPNVLVRGESLSRADAVKAERQRLQLAGVAGI